MNTTTNTETTQPADQQAQTPCPNCGSPTCIGECLQEDSIPVDE
jgi:hypothetical protein